MKKTHFGLVILTVFYCRFLLYPAPLDLQLGARAGGMGGAYSALSDDALAVSWNPAGLSFIKSGEISFTHVLMQEFSNINIDYLAFSKELKGGGFGISWLNVGAELKEKDPDPNARERTNSMSENNFTVAYSMKVSKNIGLGLSMKRLTVDSTVGSGAGLGFDLGTLWQAGRVFSMALVFKNLATNIKNESFPMLYRLGLGFRFLKDRLRLGLDVDTKYDIAGQKGISPRIHSGLEYLPWRFFSLRAGFDNENLTGGLGIIYSHWNLNYSWQDGEILGDNHRLSLSYLFDAPQKSIPGKEESQKKLTIKERTEYIKKSYACIKKKKYKKALEYADEMLKTDPEDEKAMELKKQCEEGIEEEKIKEVRELFTEGKKIYSQKKYKKAAKYFKKILEILPEHEDSKTMLQKIDEAIKSGK